MQRSDTRRGNGCRWLALMLSLGGLPSAWALQVKPMVFDMSALGQDSRKVISVANDAATPVPMEVVVNRLDLGPNGEMIRTPGGGDDFLIFPPQTVIPAHATQTFRIQWVGDPDLPQSRSYNISVNQIPVQPPDSAPPGGTRLSLQIVASFLTTVTVRPAQGLSSFEVRGAEATKTHEGKPAVALTVENTGNMHNYLANARVELRAGGWSEKLRPEDIRGRCGPALVLPGHTRRIVIPVNDLPSNPGPITGSVTFGK